MLKKFLSLFLALSLQVQAQSTSTGVDKLIIGKPGSSAPIKIQSKDGGYIKKEVSGPWIYSPDGILEKKMGSGSGSGSTGVNLLANESFEDGIASPWISSGGTFTQQSYSVSSENDLKYARFVATTSGQYVEQIVSVPTNFSAGCQADFKKVNVAAAGLFKVQALDASNNILAEQMIGVSAWIKTPTINFQCPASGANNLKLRLTSLAAGTIDFDRGYTGSNQNLVYTSQSKIIGTLKYPSVANCLWSHTSATMAPFAADSDCATPVVTGELTAPLTKIPAFRLQNAQPGTYYVIANGSFLHAGGAGQTTFRLSDGVTASDANIVYGGAAAAGMGTVTGKFTYSTVQSNVQIQLTASTPTGTNAIEADTPASDEELAFTVLYFPSSSEVAVSNEQASWFIDVNIGGANITPTSNVSSYTEISNSALDMVINTSKGSASAEIPCSGTNPSNGTICTAGNESLGVAFYPESAGPVEVCATFSSGFASGASYTGDVAYQLVETPNNSQVILQEGGERIFSNFSANSISLSVPYRVCGTFTFNDTSKKTIRLMNESSLTGGLLIYADRISSAGQRDIKFTARSVLKAFNRPVLTGDQVTTPGGTKIVTKHAIIGSASCLAPTMYGTPWLTYLSGTTIGSGCNYVMSGFSARPICTGTPEQLNSHLTNGSSTVTATSIQFRVQNNSLANVDTVVGITCVGPSN